MARFEKMGSLLVPVGTRASYLTSTAGASQGRRMFSERGVTAGPNTIVLSDGPALRARSTKLFLDNPMAAGMADSYAANCIGNGFIPEPKHAKKKIRNVQTKYWNRFVLEADADDRTDLGGLAQIACRSMLRSGESFARRRPRYLSDGLTVPLKIQMMESEQLPYWKMDGGYGNNIVRGGVELDALRQRTAYHFYKFHPGDLTVLPETMEFIRVPAADVLHIGRTLQAGMIRFLPWLTPILVKLTQLDSFDDATLERVRLGTMFIGWSKKMNPDDESGPTGPTTETAGASTAPPGVAYQELEPGTLLDNEIGEDFGFTDPPEPGTGYEELWRVQVRMLAVGFGCTYSQASGDYSQANFSSERAALNEYRRKIEVVQRQVFCYQFYRPIWRWFNDGLALAGLIDAQDYATNRADYLDCDWRTPRWEYVKPLEDALTDKELVRCGFKTQSQVQRERGGDPEQMRLEQAADNARNDELGLIPDTDSRQIDGKGQLDATALITSGANNEGETGGKPNSAGSHE